MLKSTAAIVAFLFALSTVYYLSFWGYFEINAFQYISAGDIVKGVAYPLRFAGIWIAGILGFALLLYGTYQVKTTHNVPDYAKGSLLVLFAALFMLGVSYLRNNESMATGVIASIALSSFILGFYLMLNLVHERRKAAAPPATARTPPFGRMGVITPSTAIEHPFARILDYAIVFSAVFLSANALLSGQIEARNIHSGKDYSYVLSQDLPDTQRTDAPYLIFLGAISEKYIFLDSTEREHFVIDKDELSVLRVHHFVLSDTLSSPRYTIRQAARAKELQAKGIAAKADSAQAANHLSKSEKKTGQ